MTMYRGNIYKGRYNLAFYSMNDELLHLFNNSREIAKFIEMDPTRKNMQYINLLLYRALNRKSHITYLLGKKMRVYVIDLNENEDDEEEL